jgi:hypothetical protein
MRLTVKSGNGTRVLDAYALPTDRLLVSDWEVTLLVGVSAAKRAQWTAARCAAWRAAHGGAL